MSDAGGNGAADPLKDDPKAPPDVRIARLAMRQNHLEAVVTAAQSAAELVAKETKDHMTVLHGDAVALIKQLGDDFRAWKVEVDKVIAKLSKRRTTRRRRA